MTNQRSAFRIAGLLCVLVGVSACASIHNDASPHAQMDAQRIRLAEDIHLAVDGWPDAKWWTRYKDPQLNELIERALAGSPTMAMARLRIAQAKSQTELLNAGTGLQESAFAMLDRQRASSNGFLGPYGTNEPLLGLTGPWYTEGTVGLFGGLSPDIWGTHRSAVRAALGAENAKVAELAEVELNLSTGVAQLYYSVQASHQLLGLLQQAHDALDYAVQAHQGKVAQGLEAKVPFHGARGQLLAVESQIAATQGQIKEAREALRALLGAGPDDLPEIKPVPLPDAAVGLPETLSYELLARRPDLQAMRWYVQGSLDQVAAAKAAFYPSLDIKALYALDSVHLDQLFKRSSQQINLIPGLYLPIFDGGRLNANLHNARSASNALIEQYNQAVLDAVRDVAVSGSRLEALNAQYALQTEKVEAARFAQRAAEAMYSRGLGSRLASTEARLPVISEQTALLVVEGQRINQQIVLIRALGGGYRAEASPLAGTSGVAPGHAPSEAATRSR
ncbi:outer membrane protein, multidrug efflux system [Dyella jiangningensis]|uniref:MdtP family multidrug efflux transporter outer membrane subunit n=1 Tax=Dyella sp. AtDHG13 TaxID=1938897 RepID=UPI000886AE26|nr:MdtP family multidrug efflux transporter outer membrane subunit [Dyella sp. AtDHG13]PXV61478.1 multidrug efflux system outer membrane protein [Dyella sp. AtDHG13]SDJ74493.1 outer membrane protein, multidrug efflux system [Dyella jiangningensis]